MKRLAVLAVVVLAVSCTPVPPPTPSATTVTVASRAAICASHTGLPDPTCTPGVTDSRVTQATISSTICVPGYTKTVRPSVAYTDALKAQQMALYGDTGPASAYEEDHRVPLEVGGHPSAAGNLWPEPWAGVAGAHAKDRIENRVHTDVCDGKLTLAQGQAVFLGDWWKAAVP